MLPGETMAGTATMLRESFSLGLIGLSFEPLVVRRFWVFVGGWPPLYTQVSDVSFGEGISEVGLSLCRFDDLIIIVTPPLLLLFLLVIMFCCPEPSATAAADASYRLRVACDDYD